MHRFDLHFDAEITQFCFQLLRHGFECRFTVTRRLGTRLVQQGHGWNGAATLAARLEKRNLLFFFDTRAGFDLFYHGFNLDWLAIHLSLLLKLEHLFAFAAIALAFDTVSQQVVAIDQFVDRQQCVFSEIIDQRQPG